jgi:hypothetical protein
MVSAGDWVWVDVGRSYVRLVRVAGIDPSDPTNLCVFDPEYGGAAPETGRSVRLFGVPVYTRVSWMRSSDQHVRPATPEEVAAHQLAQAGGL